MIGDQPDAVAGTAAMTISLARADGSTVEIWRLSRYLLVAISSEHRGGCAGRFSVMAPRRPPQFFAPLAWVWRPIRLGVAPRRFGIDIIYKINKIIINEMGCARDPHMISLRHPPIERSDPCNTSSANSACVTPTSPTASASRRCASIPASTATPTTGISRI
jgi:hypothetical protein